MLANDRRDLTFTEDVSTEIEDEKQENPKDEEVIKGDKKELSLEKELETEVGDALEDDERPKQKSKGMLYAGVGLLVLFVAAKMLATVDPTLFGLLGKGDTVQKVQQTSENPDEIVSETKKVSPQKEKPKGEVALDSQISKEEAKRVEYRRELISVLAPEKLEIDILGEKTEFKSDGVSYMEGEKLGNGFSISSISTKINNHSIADVEVVTVISKNNQDIIEFPMKLKDFYEFTFYNDAISIRSKKSERKIGITLPGETLTSIFTLTKVDIGDAENIYTFTFSDGTVLSVKVQDSEIQ